MAASEGSADFAAGGGKSPSTPAAEASTCRRLDDEPDAFLSCIFIYSTKDGNEAAGSHGRRRRRYSATERAQVAATRKRGACDECRDRRVKCHHAPQPPDDQYQIQSYEQFALGLTNPSTEENRHGHEKVMKKTIAALDHKLVGGQNESAGHESPDVATKQGSAGQTGRASALPSSKPLPARGRSSRRRRTPAQIHQARKPAAPSKVLPPGINKPFRLNQASSAKARSTKNKKTNISSTGNKFQSAPNDGLQILSATGMQRLPRLIFKSPLPDGHHSQNGETSSVDFEMSSDDTPATSLKDTRVTEYPARVTKSDRELGVEKASLMVVMPPCCYPGTSNISELESVTAGHEGSVCSPGQTLSSLGSEDLTSSPPAYVRLSELLLVEKLSSLPESPGQLPLQEASERYKRGRIQVESPHHFAGTQPESYTALFNEANEANEDWDQETYVSDSTTYVTGPQTAGKSLSEKELELNSFNPKCYILKQYGR